ncbi:hypothetical protein DXT57_17160, partial [Stenotrophomonas maltophilia]
QAPERTAASGGRAPEGYLQRPLQPDPPRLPTGNQLLPLPLPASGLHYRGCRAQPCQIPLQHPCPNVASIAVARGLDWRHGHRPRPRHRRLRPRPPGP